MAVFNKSSNGFSSQTTIISDGAYIKGEFILNSMLHIDGKIEGSVKSNSTVTIGKSGTIKGLVEAKKVVINGTFEGNLEAEFVEILSSGVVMGDISSLNLCIENGAKFTGKSSIKDASKVDVLEDLEIIEENSASQYL